jgi:hypothetical protein
MLISNPDGAGWIAGSIIDEVVSASVNIHYSAEVSSSGNLQGNGLSNSVLTLKDNISLTSVTASFSGSLTGTASYATNAGTASTASYVETAQTASYATNAGTAQTASYVATASYATNAGTAQTASYVQNAQTASYVATASYATNAGTAQTASYATNAGTAATASYVTASNVAGLTAAIQSQVTTTGSWTPQFTITSSLSGPSGSYTIVQSGSGKYIKNGSCVTAVGSIAISAVTGNFTDNTSMDVTTLKLIGLPFTASFESGFRNTVLNNFEGGNDGTQGLTIINATSASLYSGKGDAPPVVLTGKIFKRTNRFNTKTNVIEDALTGSRCDFTITYFTNS